MKKQLLALMAYAAFLSPASSFCMVREGYNTSQASVMKKVNLVVRFNQTDCAPAIVYADITFACGNNDVHLNIDGLEFGYSEKREVFLPTEGNIVKFSCHFELYPVNEYRRQERIYNESFSKDIEQSAICDGTTLQFHVNAIRQINEMRKAYYDVARTLSVQAPSAKFSFMPIDDNEQKNFKLQITVTNKAGVIVECKNVTNPLNGQWCSAGFIAHEDSVTYTRDTQEYPSYFQFARHGFCSGPRIEMTKENHQGKFELYPKSDENCVLQEKVSGNRIDIRKNLK